MCSPAPDRVQCVLIVQRLMDADVLLPEEGNALLAEIEAWTHPAGSAVAEGTRAYRLAEALESITELDRLDASARQVALETVRAFIHRPAESTPPATQPDIPRD